jgi:signal transduction histidine kinase
MFSQMLGYDPEHTIRGVAVRDLMVNPAGWQQVDDELTKNGSITGHELQLKQKEGSEILVALNARAVLNPDLYITWIDGVAEDVTERKVLELEMQYHESELSRYALALTQANKKLNLLSSITRHDILNQLTALFGYLELMGGDSQDPKVLKYIELEKSIAETIRKQIQFTRDYHEIGVNSPHWYDVKKTIEASTASLALTPGTLLVNIDNLSIYADPLLEKVFFNLVENALRHGKGLTWIAFSSELSGESITLICEDNGGGVPEKFKEAIFNRQHFKNTGFGLFLSREILGITGISIHETGEPGKGARFEITVPAGYFLIESRAVSQETR